MRLGAVRAAVIGLFVILYAAVLRLQVIQGSVYFRQSEQNRIRLVEEDACRGIIYDRNGIALVENRLVFDVVALPREITPAAEEAVFAALGRITGTDPVLLRDTYNHNIHYGVNSVLLMENVPREVAFRIEQAAVMPGIYVRTGGVRHYPFGTAAAHLVGYVGRIPQQDLAGLKQYGYRTQDIVGKAGLEKTQDLLLRGKPGGMQLEVDSKGKMLRVLSYRAPERGGDLQVTVDAGLQQFIAGLLKDERGAAVVMDAADGALFALCSMPSFEPDAFVDSRRRSEIAAYLQDAASPLLDRSLRTYPPGSVFKIVTGYAGLAEHLVTEQTTFDCAGSLTVGSYTKRCWLESGHGRTNLAQALTGSCNVYFYHLGLKLGDQIIARYARKFGFGAVTGVELPNEFAGVVPDAAWKLQKIGKKWFPGDSLNTAIGQGYLEVTPLQAARMTATIANGGYEVTPHLVKKKISAAKSKKILDSGIVAVIRAGMRGAVAAPNGTAHKAAVGDTAVFGKTGTAQFGKKKPHAWFAGFAAIADRNVCCLVFLEHSGHGGDRPAEIAREIIRYLCRQPPRGSVRAPDGAQGGQ
ncbi:MAG: penicillin-binding protein 2 [Candidatus Omnitrophica bacterium]|nr:penicillin-binding protein 2 [Candidatus Omnitrophota bacterium]